MPARTHASPVLATQDTPVMQVIGRIAGKSTDDNGGGTKFLMRCGWTEKTYELSSRDLKHFRDVDVRVIDDPSEYSF